MVVLLHVSAYFGHLQGIFNKEKIY